MKSKAPSHNPEDSHRFDPYKNFKFRVRWEGKYVAGFNKVGALESTIEVVEHREGGVPSPSRKLPGRTKNEPITLERGVTHDTEFEAWARFIFATAFEKNTVPTHIRKTITLEVLDEGGEVDKVYQLNGCWVSEFGAVPDLNVNANSVAIEIMVLQYEGCESAA